MDRPARSRWATLAGALGAAAVATAFVAAVRMLPEVAVDGDAAWIGSAFAATVAALAVAVSLVHLVPALRDGALDRLLLAGASATLAGAGVAALAGAPSLAAPVLGAAVLQLAAALSAGRRVPDGPAARVVAAVGTMAAAEATALVAVLPPVGDALAAVGAPILAAAAGCAVVTMLLARGPLALASALTAGGAVSLALDRGATLEGLVGVALLGGAQLAAGVAHGLDAPRADADVRLPDLAQRLSDAVLRFDGHLRLREWNAAAGALLALDAGSTGVRIDDLLGIALSELPVDGGISVSRRGVGALEVAMHRSGDGVVAVIRDPGLAPEADQLGMELRDTIEELLRARRTIHLQRGELERSATVDPLTGVASRGAILERLRIEVAQARRYRHPLAVVLLDVDRFVEINSAHGIGGGDAVLREVALRLRLRVREADALGRCGSDGFLGILPHTDEVGAATFADALRHRLAQRSVLVGEARVPVTVSIGVATMRPGEDLDVDGLMARVQEALDSARGAGGDRIALDRLHGLARLEPREPGEEPTAEPEAG
jgi:diguanylate cyclase (GGDEF)-like protein